MEDLLAQLVEMVQASPKYRHVCTEIVREIGARELARRRNLKEAVKATKNKLHQVAGAYMEGRMPYASWLGELREATRSPDAEAVRDVCRRIMYYHASTRERLPILDRFYSITLSDLAPVRSVLDVGCGLNPLAIPWMPLAEGATYIAWDIYHDMVEFLNAFLGMMPIQGHALACDVLQAHLDRRVNVALMLKMIPCLEQIEKSAGLQLLETIDADHILVSFPIHSLGGRDKGMLAHYMKQFQSLVTGRDWRVQQFIFPTELAFLISKRR
ncbi:MAG TPA: 16S rRNA methyltransferase [Caldilineae bacterium]|nr:16S rRNA methyltransferase [Caldilineae bacterium]